MAGTRTHLWRSAHRVSRYRAALWLLPAPGGSTENPYRAGLGDDATSPPSEHPTRGVETRGVETAIGAPYGNHPRPPRPSGPMAAGRPGGPRSRRDGGEIPPSSRRVDQVSPSFSPRGSKKRWERENVAPLEPRREFLPLGRGGLSLHLARPRFFLSLGSSVRPPRALGRRGGMVSATGDYLAPIRIVGPGANPIRDGRPARRHGKESLVASRRARGGGR